jgi:hypothetical protein
MRHVPEKNAHQTMESWNAAWVPVYRLLLAQ